MHDEVYRLDFVFLSDKRQNFSADSTIFRFRSCHWWSITIDESAGDRKIGFQVHQGRVLYRVGKILKLFDATICCLHHPSYLRNASRLIWFLCRELAATIEEWWHSHVQAKTVHHADSITESSIDHYNIVLKKNSHVSGLNRECYTSSIQFRMFSVFRRRISFIMAASLFEKSEKNGPIQAMMYPVVDTIIMGFNKDRFLCRLNDFGWNALFRDF